MLQLGSIVQKHSIACHSYADDAQLYISMPSDDLSLTKQAGTLINDINYWMS